MAGFFKKKGGGAPGSSAIQMTDSEATLAQSDFNTDKILEIQNKFTRGASLLYPGRIFIREGLLWKVCRKGPKKRQFFLFNDILVYGSVVANRYSNQHILPFSQMSVTAECFYQPRADADFDEEFEKLELDVANAFQICHADKSFHVFALSSADKTNWLANLHKHISRVALSLPDDQQLLTKPVWVPDSSCKECMVCNLKFTPFIRKHHCRKCGRVICSSCSPYRVALDGSTTVATTDSKKMERICKDCFKDRSTQGIRRASGGKPPPSRPPPPSVAAKAVSEVIKAVPMAQVAAGSASLPTEPSVSSHHDSSTDTEDSDDSDNESTMNNVEPAVRATSPVVSVMEMTSDLPTSTVGPDRCEVKENDDIQTDSQPTPPPRKKRLKKKLEEVLIKGMQSVVVGEVKVQGQQSQEESETVDSHKQVQDTEKEQSSSAAATEQHLPNILEEQQLTSEASPKKNRRRKKHAGYVDQTQEREDEVSCQENRTADDVVLDTEDTNKDKCLSEDTLPDEPPSSSNVEASLSNKNSDNPLLPSESHPSGLHDHTESHPPGSPDHIESADTGADDRKKRGRRNKFKYN